MAKAPLRLPPPWSTYRAVSLNTRSIGIIPLLVPLVPLMYEPVALTLWILKPIPPALCDILAVCFNVSYIPSMLSSFMVNKKHDDICGFGVPALKSVGVACVNQRSLIKLYVLMALSISSFWMPMDTRIN